MTEAIAIDEVSDVPRPRRRFTARRALTMVSALVVAVAAFGLLAFVEGAEPTPKATSEAQPNTPVARLPDLPPLPDPGVGTEGRAGADIQDVDSTPDAAADVPATVSTVPTPSTSSTPTPRTTAPPSTVAATPTTSAPITTQPPITTQAPITTQPTMPTQPTVPPPIAPAQIETDPQP